MAFKVVNQKISINFGKFHYSYGTSLPKPNDLNVRHCHDFYEILYVIDGKGKFIIEGREYPLSPHTLVVIPPLEYHYVDLNPDASYERCVVHFTDADVLFECRDLLGNFKRNGEEDANFYISNMNSSPIVSIFEQIEFFENIPEAQRFFYIKMLLSELVVLLSATNCDKVALEDADLGARVIRYLNEHIEKDISLDKLAKRFFVSKYYLCRAFKRHNGISVHGYVNQKRVMYAKQLIEAGETASRAAYRVGFGDYSAFYRAYVKIVGKSPTA
ncbi:MAG: helix-turn-helix transcriptional regulator [Clostridia bacterium]|nr:helix-turn-helix transcriptional regulator [Clostridia bacterium]